MKHSALLSLSLCLAAAPLLAQPTIGGGSCSSATIAGTYAVTFNGRGVTPTILDGPRGQIAPTAPAAAPGNLSNVFESVGTVTFDGQSKANFTLTANTAASSGASFPWAGTYTLQANCTGTITVTSGGNATLSVLVYNGGASFELAGSDSTYAYSGSGSTIATGCSTSTLVGVYAMTATGYLGVATGTAGGAASVTAIVQFDGAGNVSLSVSLSANGLMTGVTSSETDSYTGTYSLGANCTGSATISGGVGPGVFIPISTIYLSAYSGNSTLTTDLYANAASSKPNFMVLGNLMWIGPLPQTIGMNAAPASALEGGKS